MIIKKIIDICKKHTVVYLYDTPKEQWISDGYAIYPLFGLPKFDECTLCQTYDITDKQRDKIHFKHETKLPPYLSFEDVEDNETPCNEGPMYLSSAGRGIVPYMTSQGIVFIDASYLAPLADTKEAMLQVYERYTAAGQMYFAVKSGFMLLALIMPYDCINEQFVNNLEVLYKQCSIALFNKQSKEKVEEAEQGQMKFDEEAEE